MLANYWSSYTSLGESFLENLQGLTTLKIYQSDEAKNRELNQQAENFRIETMKVLKMQLNSIIIMDLIAFGGAALISYRLANVVPADRIYLVENGAVCEQGKHGELLCRNGVYARLFREQIELEHFAMEEMNYA